MKKRILISILLWSIFSPFAAPAQAATLYVDKDSIGGTCSDAYVRAENDAAHPFCTIERGDGQVVAGDTVYVREGTYTESDFALDTDGTAGNLITWESYPRRAASLVGLVHLNGEYNVFAGFRVTNNYSPQLNNEGMGIELNDDYITIRDCYIYDVANVGIRNYNSAKTNVTIEGNHIYNCSKGIGIWGSAWHVVGNTVEKLHWWPNQYLNDCDYSNGYLVDTVFENNHFFGTTTADVTFDCDNCTAENAPNDVCTSENNCDDPDCPLDVCVAHVDSLQSTAGTPPWSNNLFQGNVFEDFHQGLYISYSDPDWTRFIVRNNVFSTDLGSSGQGVLSGGYMTYVYTYNNTFYDLYSYGVIVNTRSGNVPNYALVKNNIMHTIDNKPYVLDGANSAADYNARYNCPSSGTIGGIDSDGAHDITSDPLLIGATTGSFGLQSTSPAIDAGGFLTTITTATGSGTSFAVDDAGYFWDGNGVTTGDRIELSTGAVRMITDITTNTITVDSSVSWTLGDGVALEFSGTAPDMGAYEYWGGTDVGPDAVGPGGSGGPGVGVDGDLSVGGGPGIHWDEEMVIERWE